MTPLARILAQIAEADADLRAVSPTAVDWPARAADTARMLVPWLVTNAAVLRDHVQDVLNAHTRLTDLWADLRPSLASDPRVAALDRFLALDAELRQDVTGELVSRILVAELCRRKTRLRANGKSDFPDLYRIDLDYAAVPAFRRTRRGDTRAVVYGAALKGRTRRPVRVPDGRLTRDEHREAYKLVQDEGRLAVLMDYDGIKAPSHTGGFFVLLNRSITTVQDTNQ